MKYNEKYCRPLEFLRIEKKIHFWWIPVRKSKKSTDDVQAPRNLYPPVTIIPVVHGGVIFVFIP